MTTAAEHQPQNSVEMGFLATPMKQQHPVLSDDECHHFDADNVAISRLKIRGLIAPSEADRARVKYVKRVEAAIVAALAARKVSA